MTPPDLQSFQAFWPHYLAEHRLPLCRALHYFGTALSASVLFLCLRYSAWNWAALVPLCGYGPAWIGHFLIEKNRPATFSYPLWSLLADYKMFWYWLSGQIDEELERQSHVIFMPRRNG